MGKIMIVYPEVLEIEGEKTRVRTIERTTPVELDDAQGWVDGLIEFAAEGKTDSQEDVQVVCNEEALLRDDMVFNDVGTRWANDILGYDAHVLHGPVVFIIGEDVQMQ